MTARIELEHDAYRIAADLTSARQRAANFTWVNAVGDYQCPSCWVTSASRSALLSAASSLLTEAHFECPACGFHFVEQS